MVHQWSQESLKGYSRERDTVFSGEDQGMLDRLRYAIKRIQSLPILSGYVMVLVLNLRLLVPLVTMLSVKNGWANDTVRSRKALLLLCFFTLGLDWLPFIYFFSFLWLRIIGCNFRWWCFERAQLQIYLLTLDFLTYFIMVSLLCPVWLSVLSKFK
jgi:hypothetical protein